MTTTHVTICPRCKLVYNPDSRIYKDASAICPKCGFHLENSKEYLFGRSD